MVSTYSVREARMAVTSSSHADLPQNPQIRPDGRAVALQSVTCAATVLRKEERLTTLNLLVRRRRLQEQQNR